MIVFKKIRYKNIMSTGNAPVEIDLSNTQMTMIFGKNGFGKSTILESLSFALYGKPFRKINKGQLVNNINKKDLLVELDFDANGSSWTIRRGIKPDLFEIIKDDVKLNQNAAVRDDQEYLEKNILKMNSKAFNQVAVLGRATYVPFMLLTPAQRREVIEDLLDIQVLGKMSTLCKERLNTVKKDIDKAEEHLELNRTKIEGEENKHDALKAQHEAMIQGLKDQLKDYITQADDVKQRIEQERPAYDESVKLKDQYEGEMSELEKQLHVLQNDISFLEKSITPVQNIITFFKHHDSCPTCKQSIDFEFKDSIVRDSNESIANINDKVSGLKVKVDQQSQQIDAVKEKIVELQGKQLPFIALQSDMKMANDRIQTAGNQIKKAMAASKVEDVDSTVLDNLRKTETIIKKAIDKLNHNKSVILIAQSALKDDGIKASVIEQYIPVINSMISDHLQQLELFVDFTLDNTFEESIVTGNGDKFTYNSFSEGERLRIDLAILLTWRMIAKMRNSASTNLLIMDEILDSSMDVDGINNLIESLRKMHADSNVIIISHKGDGLEDKFDRVLNVTKSRGFTSYSIGESH